MSIRTLTQLAILLAITLAFQMLGLPQPVTGPAVNGMLIISTLAIGPIGAALIGMLTPVIAFMRGILAPPLGPAIPFIVVANWAYIFAFTGLRRLNKYLALLGGTVLKFLILAGAVRFFLAVPPAVANALQFPQLITALIGGLIAFLVWGALQKTGFTKN
jgi:hypothetical protein